MEKPVTADLSSIPAVDKVLAYPEVREWVRQFGHTAVVASVRFALQQVRQDLAAGTLPAARVYPCVLQYCRDALQASLRPALRPVLNLTGTILHTNLGRAVLSRDLLLQAADMLCQPCALEFDLGTGRRGDRDDHLHALLVRLTGAEAATVVNNNAAAVMLMLNTLALRKEVIVSRGELVEIGGSFRLPEIMARAGARLREVGTTNRTHPQDYEEAVSARTGLLMKVHTGNFEMRGFTAQVGIERLAYVAGRHALPLAADLGSGALIDLQRFGLPKEPSPRELLRAGADLVAFSGDKLLGGPQAGIIVGKKAYIDRLRRNPLKRALRIDKITLAVLEATLRLYLQPEKLIEGIPALRHMARSADDIEAQAYRVLPAVRQALSAVAEISIAPCASEAGSGTFPSGRIPSRALKIHSIRRERRPGGQLQALAAALRALPLPVIGRIEKDALWLDLRCLDREAEFVQQLESLSLP